MKKLTAIALMLVCLPAWAQFVPGQVLTASQLNSQFALKAGAGANSNITSLSGLTTPLSVPQGGTGLSTTTSHSILAGNGTAAVAQIGAGTTGQMFLGVTGGFPVFGNNPTITGGTIDNAVIGGTTPVAGKFTTLQATSFITPSSTSGIVGTTTNDNAASGSVGEFIISTGTGVSLTSGTPANISSIGLTAGDWEIKGYVTFIPAGTTTVSAIVAGANTTSATLPAVPLYSILQLTNGFTSGAQQNLLIPQQRVSIASGQTWFLVVQSGFGVSTMTATGTIFARRIR